MTLTELLVVIMILVFLLGAALPVMRTALEDRALREGSRQLNTYVQLAKSRAAESGRPVGLWLETVQLPQEEQFDVSAPIRYATEVFLAEAPPPYSGDFTGARIRASSTPVGTNPLNGKAWYRAQFVVDPGAEPPVDQVTDSASFDLLVQVEDRIKFDFKGPAYRIVQLPPGDPPGSVPAGTVIFEREPWHPTPVDGDLKYQIFRLPQKSSSTPMQLSGGAVIDLTNSGLGLLGREFGTATTPVVILFNSSGAVESILGSGQSSPPSATIHLLIGSLGNLLEPGTNSSDTYGHYNRNLEDTANLWVSIGHRSGHVTSAENAWEDRGSVAASLVAAREFAQSGQAKGGR